MSVNLAQYCIYKNEISEDLSLEHVIPLSLGGHDKFSIYVDRAENNGPASKADSGIANDFLIKFARKGLNTLGHSKKPPEPQVKHGSLSDGTKVQITFAKNSIRIFDVRLRKELKTQDLPDNKLICEGISIDLEADVRFVAKVALSAGYYTYGESFERFVWHEEARKIMRSKKLKEVESEVRIVGRFDHRTDDIYTTVKAIIEQDHSSCVLMIPGDDCLGVAVGVLGTFMGLINIPALGHDFPNEGEYRLGRAIFIRNGTLIEQSFYEACLDLSTRIKE